MNVYEEECELYDDMREWNCMFCIRGYDTNTLGTCGRRNELTGFRPYTCRQNIQCNIYCTAEDIISITILDKDILIHNNCVQVGFSLHNKFSY